MLDRIAKPMFIRILMIIVSALLAFMSYLIIYILIGIRRVTGLDGLYPFYNIFKVTPVIAIVTTIASVVIVILGYHRFKRVKQDTYSLINALSAVIYLILLLINIPFFRKVGQIVAKDDIYSLKTLFNGQGVFSFRVLFVISMVLVIYNVVILLIALKVIRLSIFIPDHISNTKEVRVGDKVLTNTQAVGEETRLYLLNLNKTNFFKTANGLVVLFTAIAIVVTFVGYTFYDRYIVCDAVDLGSHIGINPNYNVESGKGKLLTTEITNKLVYKGKSKEAKAYLEDLIDNPDNYTISKSNHLKNGDFVTITVNYDEQRCDDLHIRVTNNKVTRPIKGFISEFKNGKEVAHTKNVLAMIKRSGDERMNETYKGKKYTIKFDSAWLCRYNGSNNDAIVLIYRVENKGNVSYVNVYSTENITTNYVEDIHTYTTPEKMLSGKKAVTTSKQARSLVSDGKISETLDNADQTYLIDG